MVQKTIKIPENLTEFRLPDAVHARLQFLLERLDEGETLQLIERKEADGLVQLAEFLSLLNLCAKRSEVEGCDPSMCTFAI